ncbi:peptidase [Lysobacter concretionis Ko07 = DSM 16239]|jgi:stringent starvation protein B|uniref:Peptidase n=1 Tax=Lysobacter concretionis Ko07 = DSM 16239 TaxID=1122185 RepID=A0A0A0ELI6_9GAMM|nr:MULTISPECIES: ClpXP protease specificity-enhancing factor [Lysobacter]KGM51003.1 peptidase [Lysobacter concretionis Ko07 = DSM 16239]QOD90426.1 ClpXP protease specificity-enhancing factor [Lysobacter sp. CW239]
MTEESAAMTSHRPYLLRALYEWIADNGMTPHLLVDATRAGVQVPLHAVKEGRIVLNVADRAVAGLEMSNELIRFSARFGGVSQSVSVPVGAVIAIYARETGQGMALPEEIGDDSGHESGIAGLPQDAPARPSLSAVPSDPATQDEDGGPDKGPDAPGPRRGGHLKVVK